MHHTLSDMDAMVKYLNSLDDTFIILMEYTRHYHYPKLKKLQEERFPVCQIHKAKADKKDALRITKYALAKSYMLTPYTSLAQKYEDLKFLSRQYNQRISTVSYTKTHLTNLLDEKALIILSKISRVSSQKSYLAGLHLCFLNYLYM